jgi:hypothetical protein
MKGHVLSTMHVICVTAGAVIENGTTLALRDQDLKRSGGMCATCASLVIFGCPTTLSSMMAIQTLAFGWRNTTSRVERGGWTMTSSSSSSSPFTWSTCPELHSITCQKTRSIVGRISRRSLPASLRADTCSLAIPSICRAVGKSRTNLSGITSDISPKSVTNSPRSMMLMSSRRSSLAQTVEPWCMSSAMSSQRQ